MPQGGLNLAAGREPPRNQGLTKRQAMATALFQNVAELIFRYLRVLLQVAGEDESVTRVRCPRDSPEL